MAQFNKAAPFGTIHGRYEIDGVAAKYYQDGVHYNNRYEPLDAPADEVEDVETVLDDTSADETVVVNEDTSSTDVTAPGRTELEDLPYQRIKERVEALGGAWTNKVEGINFLLGE